MPTFAPPELIQHIENHGIFTAFTLQQREPDTPLASPQTFVDAEIRTMRRDSPSWFRYAYETTGFLSGHKYAFRLHPSWTEDKPILWGCESQERPTIARALEDWARPQEHVEFLPEEPTWVETEFSVKTTRRTFRFPPLGEDKVVTVQNVRMHSRIPFVSRGETGQSLDTRFVRTIIKFGHPKKLARKPPEVRFVQLVTRQEQKDGSEKRETYGNIVQIWRMDPWECIGFLMPLTGDR